MDFVPMGDFWLTKFPAEEHDSIVKASRKINQPDFGIFQLAADRLQLIDVVRSFEIKRLHLILKLFGSLSPPLTDKLFGLPVEIPYLSVHSDDILENA